MIRNIGGILKGLAPYRGFFLTFTSIFGLFVLAFYKDVDINSSLPAILGLYLGTKASEKASAHWAASRDPNASTADVISSVTEK